MKLLQWNVLLLWLVVAAANRRPDRSTPVIKSKTTANFNMSTTTTTTAPVTYRKVYFPEDENFPSAAQVDDAHTIPLSLLRHLSEAETMEDFLPWVDNFVPEARYQQTALVPKSAVCTPELQTVSLAVSNDPNVLYYPTCTRIERCGGCCSSSFLSCEPDLKEDVVMQVIRTRYKGGKTLSYDGKELITVEKHLSCKCQCKVKETDCNENQFYMKNQCKCECSNKEMRSQCEEQIKTRYWDPHTCQCMCREVTQCSTGLHFNQETCSCETRSDGNSEDELALKLLLGEGGRMPMDPEEVPKKKTSQRVVFPVYPTTKRN